MIYVSLVVCDSVGLPFKFNSELDPNLFQYIFLTPQFGVC